MVLRIGHAISMIPFNDTVQLVEQMESWLKLGKKLSLSRDSSAVLTGSVVADVITREGLLSTVYAPTRPDLVSCLM